MGTVTEMFKRSIFGYVSVYNRLPQHVVEVVTARKFQAALQNAVKRQAKAESDSWQLMGEMHTPMEPLTHSWGKCD